ncbi:GNAT family N-acetyltransferase [Streptomyces sp. NPDC001811]
MNSVIPASVKVRRANQDDAAALVRLRALMLEDMGLSTQETPWRHAALEWFTERLGDTQNFAAFVVDDPHLGPVSNAVGICDRHAPSPHNLSGIHGHVFNISTDPSRQRRGYARACLKALLDWYGNETEARVINLNATGHGMALYRSLGFAAPRYPALQLRTGRRE